MLTILQRLLVRINDLRGCVVVFDGQIIFSKKYTRSEWCEKVDCLLQSSDEVVVQLSEKSHEFNSLRHEICDTRIEYDNRKRITSLQPINRCKKLAEHSCAASVNISPHHPEEPFVGCLDRVQELDEIYKLLRWAQDNLDAFSDKALPEPKLVEKYGDLVFELDIDCSPTKVLCAGKELKMHPTRRRLLWVIMKHCYNEHQLISFDMIAQELPNRPSDRSIRKYKTDVNDTLKRALGLESDYIIAAGTSNPRCLKLAF